jgi:hypothetical protein
MHKSCLFLPVILLCALFLLAVPASADLIAPAITHVYFEKNGTPYNGSVDYSVNCYGYMKPPFSPQPTGSYQPERVFTYSASCPGYGCTIYQPYYLQYTHIDWCDVSGTAGNRSFKIQNFSDEPYTRCSFVPDRVQRTGNNHREYYYETPEYFACTQFRTAADPTIWADHLYFSDTVLANSSPKWDSLLLLEGSHPFYQTPNWSHHIINKTEIAMDSDQYIGYLETCNPVTDQNCPGWIVNGTPLKTFTQYRPFKDNTSILRTHPCDAFLVKADPGLIMPFSDEDPWHHPCVDACNYTREICESHFTIPSGNVTTSVTGIPAPGSSMDVPAASVITREPNETVAEAPAVHSSPVESLYCSIVELLRGRCE